MRALVLEDMRGDLDPLLGVLRARRVQAHAELVAALRSKRATDLLAAWRVVPGRPRGRVAEDDRPDAARPIGAVAGQRIRKVYRKMVRMGDAIDDASPAEDYHELRKKGKELRYLLELFGAPLFPGEVVKPMIKTLKGLQDVLGRHQDREVQVALLRSLGSEVAQGRVGRARADGDGGVDRASGRGRACGALRVRRQLRRVRVHGAATPSQGDLRVMNEHHLPTTTYEADPAHVNRVLLLYSGGLDTSVMLKWIQEQYQAEVVALTVNLGQPGEDYEVIRGKALRLGALDCHVVDAREEFAREYIVPAIKANGTYGLGYPLFTALGRPLIAKLAVEYARRSGCDTVAHGCTGKGNDQVRIDATVATLGPELRVIAPVRGWRMGRDEEVAYAREHGIPVKGGTEQAPYSIDDNLWGRSSEGRWIEELDHAPEDDVFQLVTRPEEAPDEPEMVTVEFERGVPVALNGERLGLVSLLERAGEIGARHGIGIVDHIEDRIVGLKVRDIYEVPAAAILLLAHRELETLVGTIHQNQLKPVLDQKWAYLVYAGLWWDPLRSDLDAYMEAANAQVTGSIGIKLYKGSARAVTRSSPHAVYDAQLATFAESGGLFAQAASPGFIELWSLQSRMAWRLRDADGG